jgi:hypothetical protein
MFEIQGFPVTVISVEYVLMYLSFKLRNDYEIQEIKYTGDG